MKLIDFKTVSQTLKKGGIIAYPTEGVFGLGCDPFNKKAVLRLLKIKERPIEKGLILVGASQQQFESLALDLSKTDWEKINQIFEVPCTWLVPASPKVPIWIRGLHNSVAIRIIQHPIAQKICEFFQNPLVSTSANKTGSPPCLTVKTVRQVFQDKIDLIVEAETLGLNKPSRMIDLLTGKILRK